MKKNKKKRLNLIEKIRIRLDVKEENKQLKEEIKQKDEETKLLSQENEALRDNLNKDLQAIKIQRLEDTIAHQYEVRNKLRTENNKLMQQRNEAREEVRNLKLQLREGK